MRNVLQNTLILSLILLTIAAVGSEKSRKETDPLALNVLEGAQCHNVLSASGLTDPRIAFATVRNNSQGLVSLLLSLKNPTVHLEDPRSIIVPIVDQLHEIDPNEKGHLRISHCSATGCGFVCCEFDRNFILMFPGEWERAEKAGYDLSNLDVLKIDRFGGRRVRPKNKACCSSGKNQWKSLDCASYPLFPILQSLQNEKQFSWICGGSKCPLTSVSSSYRAVLERHLIMVERAWLAEIRNNSSVAEWLASEVEMVGYDAFVPTLR